MLVKARRGEQGVVYCLSRKSADSTAEFLSGRGVRAAAYHGGMDPDERARTQDRFIRDDLDVVCATIAFGMGIDKSNVRYVIHRDMPRSIEGYYQEIGRRGRDGAVGGLRPLTRWADVMALEAMAENSQNEDPDADRAAAHVRPPDVWACRWVGLSVAGIGRIFRRVDRGLRRVLRRLREHRYPEPRQNGGLALATADARSPAPRQRRLSSVSARRRGRCRGRVVRPVACAA
jgi:superfamily II DNA/RNA helicase